MTRKLSDMTPEEQQMYRIYTERIGSSASSETERQEATIKRDALEWKGQTGPVMELLTKLEARVTALENSNSALSPDLLAEVVDEAKTAVYAEAVAAARQAVSDLVGELPEKKQRNYDPSDN